MNSQLLTLELAKTLIGKQITFTAPAYNGNYPYKGIGVITAVDAKEERPITFTSLDGDNLQYAFLDQYCFDKTSKYLCYSDGGRFVKVTIN